MFRALSLEKAGMALIAVALVVAAGSRMMPQAGIEPQAEIEPRAQVAPREIETPKSKTRDFAAKLAERREQRIAEELARQEAAGVSSVEIERNMRLGERYQASLIVQRGGEARAQVEAMAKEVPEPTAILRDVTITEEARAAATSSSLIVIPTSPEWQTFGPNTPAIWTWIVEPRQEGTAHLRIDLWQKVRIGDDERVVPVKSWPQTIEVSVSGLQRLMSGLGGGQAWGAMEAMARVGGALGLVMLVWGRAKRWQASRRIRARKAEGDTVEPVEAVVAATPEAAPAKAKRKPAPRRGK